MSAAVTSALLITSSHSSSSFSTANPTVLKNSPLSSPFFEASEDAVDPAVTCFDPDYLLVTFDPTDFLPFSSGTVIFHEHRVVLV